MAGISAEAGLKLLSSGAHSDFLISCRDVEFKVHKAIICADSHFFQSVCGVNFHEGREGKVTLEEEEPEIVARALSYLYTKRYDAANPPTLGLDIPSEARSEIEVYVMVYVCAEKLGIQSLKSHAKDEILHHLGSNVVTIPGLEKAVERIFSTTACTDNLRLVMTRACMSELFKMKHANARSEQYEAHFQLTEKLMSIIGHHEPLALNLGKLLIDGMVEKYKAQAFLVEQEVQRVGDEVHKRHIAERKAYNESKAAIVLLDIYENKDVTWKCGGCCEKLEYPRTSFRRHNGRTQYRCGLCDWQDLGIVQRLDCD